MNCLTCNQETNNPKFCSRSCAAKHNNKLHPKRKPEGNCKLCNTPTTTSLTYCSNCWNQYKSTIVVPSKFKGPKTIRIPNNQFCEQCKCKLSNRRKFCGRTCQSLSIFLNRISVVEKQGYFYDETVFRTGNSVEFVRKYIKHKFGDKCSICNLESRWNNMSLNLILDHINGIPNDWTISNLRLICPNCDAQTPTFKSKNKGNGRPYRPRTK